jgi:hypothetical protein
LRDSSTDLTGGNRGNGEEEKGKIIDGKIMGRIPI